MSTTAADRLQRLVARIDALNREDPNTEQVGGGAAQPRELVYSQRLTDWVLRLNPQASEALRIAARGQHVQRWTIPRDRYERNRKGYLRWREALKTFHAETITRLMHETGYDEASRERVRLLILKKQLGVDPETQTLEDALCLVFLETQFADLMQKEPRETMREILRKTWAKMSAQGRQAALQLPLPPEQRQLVEEALL